jgi:voltage-gated potassium channel
VNRHKLHLLLLQQLVIRNHPYSFEGGGNLRTKPRPPRSNAAREERSGRDERRSFALLRQLAIASAALTVLALVHFSGLTVLFLWLRERQPRWSRFILAPVPILVVAFGGVMALHTAEIWAFAAFYLLVGALPDLETALYFSTTSYASIGYGDVVLGREWRLVGAIEGAMGAILLGCSIAFLVAVVTELQVFERRPGLPRRGQKRRLKF